MSWLPARYRCMPGKPARERGVRDASVGMARVLREWGAHAAHATCTHSRSAAALNRSMRTAAATLHYTCAAAWCLVGQPGWLSQLSQVGPGFTPRRGWGRWADACQPVCRGMQGACWPPGQPLRAAQRAAADWLASMPLAPSQATCRILHPHSRWVCTPGSPPASTGSVFGNAAGGMGGR